ncbi:MAG: hypothetical protein WBA87_05960 [Microbacterium sp.]
MVSLRHRAREVVDDIASMGDRNASRHFAEVTASRAGASTFDGLTSHSLAVASARPRAGAPRAINLLLPELSPGVIFAGIRTAIELSASLADSIGAALRLIYFQKRMKAQEARNLELYLDREFSREIEILHIRELATAVTGRSDVWVATHWTTAHSLDVAVRLGVVEKANCIYLVQDYEPGFMPWSTEFALAQATYHAGFTMIVNSSPVAQYLRAHESVEVPRQLVFRPKLDIARLEQAAMARSGHQGPPRIAFYARPNKPRNMFRLGMTALHQVVDQLGPTSGVEIVSMGASHGAASGALPTGMKVLGLLDWSRYFGELSRTDVMLSLQMSPHPSHPPLDAVVAGGFSVTNELGGVRGGLHPHLHAVEAEPDALAEALVQTLSESRAEGAEHRFTPEMLEALGESVDHVVATVSEMFGS